MYVTVLREIDWFSTYIHTLSVCCAAHEGRWVDACKNKNIKEQNLKEAEAAAAEEEGGEEEEEGGEEEETWWRDVWLWQRSNKIYYLLLLIMYVCMYIYIYIYIFSAYRLGQK